VVLGRVVGVELGGRVVVVELGGRVVVVGVLGGRVVVVGVLGRVAGVVEAVGRVAGVVDAAGRLLVLGAVRLAGVVEAAAPAAGRVAPAFVAAAGMVFGVAFKVEAGTLPPAALAGTTFLEEKSPACAVAAMAGLPPLFLARS
jgi:hypothetical protein